MSKNAKEHRNASGHAAYKASLRKLQIELVKVQRHVIKHGHKDTHTVDDVERIPVAGPS